MNMFDYIAVIALGLSAYIIYVIGYSWKADTWTFPMRPDPWTGKKVATEKTYL